MSSHCLKYSFSLHEGMKKWTPPFQLCSLWVLKFLSCLEMSWIPFRQTPRALSLLHCLFPYNIWMRISHLKIPGTSISHCKPHFFFQSFPNRPVASWVNLYNQDICGWITVTWVHAHTRQHQPLHAINPIGLPGCFIFQDTLTWTQNMNLYCHVVWVLPIIPPKMSCV